MTQILIIGNGIVGNATGRAFSKYGHTVNYWDVIPEKCTIKKLDNINKYDFIMICVPTPTDIKTYEQDIEPLHDAINLINRGLGYKGIVVIKSTCLPGTTASFLNTGLNLLHSPEFLTAKNAYEEAEKPDRVIVSGKLEHCQKFIDLYPEELIKDKFKMFDNYQTTELAKYMNNCFLATKVTMANMFYDLAKDFGANYKDVKSAVVMDERIGNSHLDVSPNRGYGGMCFPKDLKALIGTKDYDNDFTYAVLESIDNYNKNIRG